MSNWNKPEPERAEANGGNPSRWWIVFHLWGGICLYAYVVMSGLPQIVLGEPVGLDPSAASTYASYSAALVVGAVALGYFLSKLFIDYINSSDISGKMKTAIKILTPFAYFGAAIMLTILTLPILSEPSTSIESSPLNSGQSPESQVKAYTTIQSSEGIGESDLDEAALEKMESWMIGVLLKKGRAKFEEMGYDPKDFKPKLTGGSVYVKVDGRKLAVVKVNIGDVYRTVTIVGIKGAELVRVSCMREGGKEIFVWSGECGKEIKKAFGISMNPLVE